MTGLTSDPLATDASVALLPVHRPSAKALLYQAIRNDALLTDADQRLSSPTGRSNAWLIDMRRIFMDPHVLDAAADLFWERFSDRLPFQVGGMEVAAIPLLSAILMKSVARGTPVNGFIVRKERKTYGTGGQIEGQLTADPIVIVDDLINSGHSLEKVRAVLQQAHRSIGAVFTLIHYQSRSGSDWVARHRIDLVAPFTIADFGLSLQGAPSAPLPPLFRNVWRFSSPDPNLFQLVPKSFPATDGDRVFFGSDSGLFWCIDAERGQPVWSKKVQSPGHKNIWSAPAVHASRVYFGSYDGNVYCLDALTGKEIWRNLGADWVGSSPALAPDVGRLFIGLEFGVEGRRGSIACLDLETGETLWEHRTRRYTHASPAYWPKRQLVACGSNDNELFLFDALTGALKWRFETRGEAAEGSIRHAPAFDPERGQIITGCADGVIYIVDVETGREVWSVKTDNTIYSVPLVVGAKAYLGSTDKHLYILDLEKREVVARIPAGAKVFSPPRLIEGKIYFGASNGVLFEIDPTTDAVTGRHQLPDAMTNAITYSRKTGLYYALTYANELFALKKPTPASSLLVRALQGN